MITYSRLRVGLLQVRFVSDPPPCFWSGRPCSIDFVRGRDVGNRCADELWREKIDLY